MNTSTFTAALFDELETLYPDTSCEAGKDTLKIDVASGSYGGFNIMLNGLTPGQAVTFSVSIKNRMEKPKNWRLFAMQAVPVEYNTAIHDRTEQMWPDEYNTDTIRRAPFLVYDILKPIYNIEEVQYTAQAYCFRFLSDCKEYRRTPFEIEITHCGITRKLTCIADEYPAAVPAIGKDTHKYVNWFSLDNMVSYHHVEKWSPAFYQILYRYLRAAAYTRQNMMAVSIMDFLDRDAAGDPLLNTERLDAVLETAQKAGMYWIEGSALTGRKDGEWGAREAECSFDRKIIPGEGEATLRRIARQLNSYITERGLQDRWMQSVLDEPSNELEQAYTAATDIVKEEMPGIPILEPTIGSDSLSGTVNVWCPPVNIFEKKLDFFRKRVEAGDRIFVYTCLNPGGPYCNRLLDMEKLREVYLSWGSIIYPFVEGFLHWGGNQYCGRNPYTQTCMLFTQDDFDYTTDMASVLPAGDGFIFYPGEYGKVYSSVRAEAHRIGLEDLELLEQAAAKDRAYTEKLVQTIFRSFHDYDTDITRYRAVKKELLSFLSDPA